MVSQQPNVIPVDSADLVKKPGHVVRGLTMTELFTCITFWESKLFHDKYMMSPASQYLVETTVKFLKKLQASGVVKDE